MPKLVFIPGLVSDARVWAGVKSQMEAHTQCIDAEVTSQHSIESMAESLLQSTEGDIVPVGHSMGGRVAMEMARLAPVRVKALVLANTGHDVRKPDEEPKRLAKIALGHSSMQSLAEQWLPGMLTQQSQSDATLMSSLTEMVLQVGADVHERQIRALLNRPDAGAYLPHIHCPILLMTGTQDRWSPPKQHQDMLDMAPNAALQLIENAGHFMPVEQPEQTAKHVMQFWRSHFGSE